MKIFINSFLIITLFLITTQMSFAAPSTKLCINNECKKPLTLNITDSCWADVKEIFSTPFSTDKDEQDNIINAIALIEFDLYHSFAHHSSEKNNAENFYTDNSNRNNYLNIKNILNILLDNYMVTRHAMRKTTTQKTWSGIKTTGLMLQSLTDGQLYILQAEANELGNTALIKPYKKSSLLDFLPTEKEEEKNNNDLIDDDFE